MSTATQTATSYDEGMRQFMLSLFNQTAVGVGITGLVAWIVASVPALSAAVFGTPLVWVAMFAPLGMILWYSFAGRGKMSLSGIRTFYYAFAAVMGISMASVFMVYTGVSIARVFFITSAVFGAASLYGYTTKRDLTAMGSFLMIGLIGIIIAAIVNIFLASSALMFAISVIGVVVFTSLTAYDTQYAKEVYGSTSGEERDKGVYDVALSLYLNFINLFNMLMSLLGQRD